MAVQSKCMDVVTSSSAATRTTTAQVDHSSNKDMETNVNNNKEQSSNTNIIEYNNDRHESIEQTIIRPSIGLQYVDCSSQ
eukprot:14350486-Ditylum_brightwellii.AAC.1